MKNKTFKEFNLDSALLEAIDDCGYFSCTPTQEKTIPSLLQGGNFLVQAATGTGKTAAFCIPLIQKLKFESTHPTVLILAPTRELAYQIQTEFNRLGLYKKIHGVACVGKESMSAQILQLKQRTHAIIGTPGRIYDLAINGHVDLSKIEILVVDEATEMISFGLLDQLEDLSNLLSVKTTWLFSATLESTNRFDFLPLENAVRIETETPLPEEQIQSSFFEAEDIDEGLDKILEFVPISSGFIFANTQQEATDIYHHLKDQGYRCSLIHGGLPQKNRHQALAQFKSGSSCLLIATNVAARGVDVENVSCVIHYRCPLDQDSYIHRTGRVGRKHFIGQSIVLSDSYDRSNIKEEIKKETIPFLFPKTKAKNTLHKALYREDQQATFKEKNSSLFIRAGKKDKIRSNDVVGALCSIENISQENIGIINIQPSFTTVTLLNINLDDLPSFDGFTIKGKRRKVELKRQ